MRIVFLILLSLCAANAQSLQRNDLTFSGGYSYQVGNTYESDTAVGLGGTYGYRFTPHIEAEAGAFVALNPTPPSCASFGCYNSNNRFVWVPFGVRLILPVKQDRLEFSVGAGGLYENYSVSNAFSPVGYSGWGGYGKVSAAVALDQGRHFWIGATPRFFLANPAYQRDRWFMITGDFSFRF